MTIQLVIFKAFFRLQTLNLKKIPINQLIKKIGLSVALIKERHRKKQVYLCTKFGGSKNDTDNGVTFQLL